jgi:hypothetical protein
MQGHKSNQQVSDHGAVVRDDFSRKHHIASSRTTFDTPVVVGERYLAKTDGLESQVDDNKMVDGGREDIVEICVDYARQRDYSAFFGTLNTANA